MKCEFASKRDLRCGGIKNNKMIGTYSHDMEQYQMYDRKCHNLIICDNKQDLSCTL